MCGQYTTHQKIKFFFLPSLICKPARHELTWFKFDWPDAHKNGKGSGREKWENVMEATR